MPLALKVVLLAVVQGLTEFFPVSSSGHLVLFQKLLNFTTLPLVYDIFFHLGTLLAVVTYFRRDLRELALRFYRKENLRLIGLLAAASVPTALMGLLFRDFFESLFSRPAAMGFAFLFTGAALLAGRYLRLRVRIPDLAAALGELLTLPPLDPDAQARQYETAKAHFSPERGVAAYAALYRPI